MTKDEIINRYPKTWEGFKDWFNREGWGAGSADELSEYGVKEWFPDFLREFGIDDIEEYENLSNETNS